MLNHHDSLSTLISCTHLVHLYAEASRESPNMFEINISVVFAGPPVVDGDQDGGTHLDWSLALQPVTCADP